jgi:hypothetical protein
MAHSSTLEAQVLNVLHKTFRYKLVTFEVARYTHIRCEYTHAKWSCSTSSHIQLVFTACAVSMRIEQKRWWRLLSRNWSESIYDQMLVFTTSSLLAQFSQQLKIMDGKSVRITTTGHGLTAASYKRHRVQNNSLSIPSFRDLGFVFVTVIISYGWLPFQQQLHHKIEKRRNLGGSPNSQVLWWGQCE